MDQRIAIWNTLHDGEITVAAREGESLLVFVSIPYLRVRLAPLGDSFSLRLFGLRAIELSRHDGGYERTSSLEEIAMNGIEILSTDSTDMPVKIKTTQGLLTLDFDDLEIRLDTGQVVDYGTILAACNSYWDEWQAKAEHNEEARNHRTESPPTQPPAGSEPRQQ